MKRHVLLLLLLLLSIGINVGLLIGHWMSGTPEPRTSEPGTSETEFAEDGSAKQVPPRLERMIERMADELLLTGAELERFLEIQRRFFRQSIDQGEKARRARRALRQELFREQPERARAEALNAAIADAQRGVEEAFIANYFETRELLRSPEQRRLFFRFMVRVRQLRQELERRMEARGDGRDRSPNPQSRSGRGTAQERPGE